MQKDDEELDGASAAFDRGGDEAKRRNAGDFDGLMGNPDGPHSKLLTALFFNLRDYLLDRYTDDDALELLHTHARMLRGEAPLWSRTKYDEAPDDILFVVQQLDMIVSTLNLDPNKRDELILGIGGVRDKNRQAGVRKGGLETARVNQENARAWQGTCVARAEAMLKSGTPRRDLAGILAARFGMKPQTVRRLLKRDLPE